MCSQTVEFAGHATNLHASGLPSLGPVRRFHRRMEDGWALRLDEVAGDLDEGLARLAAAIAARI